jgi:hypothetical protein
MKKLWFLLVLLLPLGCAPPSDTGTAVPDSDNTTAAAGSLETQQVVMKVPGMT